MTNRLDLGRSSLTGFRWIAIVLIGVGWGLVARYASSVNARWLYDAGSPWAIVGYLGALVIPGRALWLRVAGAFGALFVGLIVYYNPYRPAALWVEVAGVAAILYGYAAWTSRRRPRGWTQVIPPALVGAPFFLEALWSFVDRGGYPERGWPFILAGIVVSAAVANTWKGRILGPTCAAIAGGVGLCLVFLVFGSDAGDLL